MSVIWNLWHGCIKISEGCKNCYVFRRDALYGIDSRNVYKTKSYDLPIMKKRDGSFKVPSGEHLWTCFSSDFFIENADEWRDNAWAMMRIRKDLSFSIATKRVERIEKCLPEDWGSGYENVSLLCSIENQKQADLRLPLFRNVLIKKKSIICEPLLGPIDLTKSLAGGWIDQVIVGGESGDKARVCNFEWVEGIRQACIKNNVTFIFKQTGAHFMKDGKSYNIAGKLQSAQARKANLNFTPHKD